MAAAHSDNVEHRNTDVAARIAIATPKIDRPGIHAALGVSEFWRVRKGSATIEHLRPNEK